MLEQLASCASQVVPQPFGLTVATVDQRLKIAFQMCPAPLQTFYPPVHLGAIARDDAAKLVGEQIVQRRRLTRGTHREHRERPGHERPQPSLPVLFLGRRFVGAELVLRRQFSRQRFVRRPQGCRHLSLHLHRQRRTARLTEQRAEELGRAPLALTVIDHQQSGESHQPRARLTLWHAAGQFPDLVPQRPRVAARQLLASSTALLGLERLHTVAVFAGKQRPLMFRMARLSPAFLLRLAFPRRGLAVRMQRAGRQRGVLRRLAFYLPSQLVKLCFQLRYLDQQRPHEPTESSRLRVPAGSRADLDWQTTRCMSSRKTLFVSKSVLPKNRSQGVNACSRKPCDVAVADEALSPG